jgi:lysine-N-methylase
MTDQKFKRLIPTYFNDFQCIGGECEDTCCAGWNITIDKKTYKRYENEKNITLQSNLKKSIMPYKTNTDHSYGKFKLNETNHCSLLSEDGLCTIHALLGADALSHTCAIYPRNVTLVNELLEKSLMPSCPEATRLMIMQPDGISFIEEEGEETLAPSNTIKLSDTHYDLLWAIRIFMINTLQDRRHSIEIRLMICAMFIQKYKELATPNLPEVQNLCTHYKALLNNQTLAQSFSKIQPTYELQLSLAYSLSQYTKSEKFSQVANRFIHAFDLKEAAIPQSSTLYTQSLRTTYPMFTDAFGYTLENYLVNQVYSLIKEAAPSTVAKRFTEICVDFSMIRAFMLGFFEAEQIISLEAVVTTIQQFSRNFAQNSEYIRQIDSITQKDDASLLAKLTGYIFI